jgi:hypothetical protein
MNNMKLFAQRVYLVHWSMAVITVIFASVLNYLMWEYTPDTRFETLETLLLPFARPAITLATVGLVVNAVFNPHTMRIMRKLAYFKK